MNYFKYEQVKDNQSLVLYVITEDDGKFKVFSKSGEHKDKFAWAFEVVNKLEADKIDEKEFNKLLEDFKKAWVDNNTIDQLTSTGKASGHD